MKALVKFTRNLRRYGVVLLLQLCFGVTSHASVLVLAGGGAEGDIGDTDSWSYALYRSLFDPFVGSGDALKVVVLAEDDAGDTQFLPNYLVWLGEGRGLDITAQHLGVGNSTLANDAAHLAPLLQADVVFIKGGDQGQYYRNWQGSLLAQRIRAIHAAGGSVGGTSAGAMSAAGFCLCGGRDLVSEDVMADSHSDYMNDADNLSQSGIRNDFLGLLPDALIDTHFTQRGRLGRLLGVLAKALDDTGRQHLLAVGLELRSGIVVQNGQLQVFGRGSVTVLQPSPQTQWRREPGQPLVMTEVRLDRLVEGWGFDLRTRRPLPPGSAIPRPGFSTSSANSGALSINGSQAAARNAFERVATHFPLDFSVTDSTGSNYVTQALGFENVGDPDARMDRHETLFHALHDQPELLGVLLFRGSRIQRDAGSPDQLRISPEPNYTARSALLISAREDGHNGLSTWSSNWVTAGGALRAAALTNLRVHVLADSVGNGIEYQSREHRLLGADRIFRHRFAWE